MKNIRSASHPATNDKIFQLITEQGLNGKKILDMGAGRGFMSQKLGTYANENNINPTEVLNACDMFPEFFEYKGISCDKVSFANALPYNDNTFDIVYAIEVLEHLRSPYDFITELFRVIKPGGMVIISVPNVLNLASRISYLLHGFFDLFEPLSFRDEDAGRLCGHIMPLGYFYINHGMRKAGFESVRFEADRLKRSSLALYFALYPFLKYSISRFISNIKNKNSYLYEANKSELGIINSKRACCSRSCILVGNKPF